MTVHMTECVHTVAEHTSHSGRRPANLSLHFTPRLQTRFSERAFSNFPMQLRLLGIHFRLNFEIIRRLFYLICIY